MLRQGLNAVNIRGTLLDNSVQYVRFIRNNLETPA